MVTIGPRKKREVNFELKFKINNFKGHIEGDIYFNGLIDCFQITNISCLLPQLIHNYRGRKMQIFRKQKIFTALSQSGMSLSAVSTGCWDTSLGMTGLPGFPESFAVSQSNVPSLDISLAPSQ